MNDIHIDGLHLACAFGGIAIGLICGYIFGWLHFSEDKHDAR